MYYPDLNSRYFTADFPLGLDILLSFSAVLDSKNADMKMVSDWYHNITHTSLRFRLSQYGIGSMEIKQIQELQRFIVRYVKNG